MGYTIDIDTGGTFTDGFFVCGERVEIVKVSTTPHDLTVCFLKCVEAGAERFGIPVEDLLYEKVGGGKLSALIGLPGFECEMVYLQREPGGVALELSRMKHSLVKDNAERRLGALGLSC